MEDCKAAPTPGSCEISENVLKAQLFNSTTYRKAIGSLMSLMIRTRSNIAFAVGRQSQDMKNPTVGHWTYAKKVFKFFKETSTLGFIFNGQCCELTPV